MRVQSRINNQPSFSAALTINAEKALYKGRKMISDDHIEVLRNIAKKIGTSPEDQITVNVGPLIISAIEKPASYEANTKILAAYYIGKKLDIKDLSTTEKVWITYKPYNAKDLGAFNVIKEWLESLIK